MHILKLKAMSKKSQATKVKVLHILILASTVFYIVGKKRYFTV